MHFDERRVFLFTRERQKFAKVFHKQKGEDSQKSFSRKKAKIRKKYSSRKGRVLQKYFKYSSILKKNQIVWVVYKGMKKTLKFIISISEQKLQWQSLDLNTWGLHYPSATGIRSREGDEPRPAFRGGRLCSAPIRYHFEGPQKCIFHVLNASAILLFNDFVTEQQ